MVVDLADKFNAAASEQRFDFVLEIDRIGAVNLGFALIALNYALSWVLAIVYGRIAADKFDPIAARAVSEIRGRGH